MDEALFSKLLIHFQRKDPDQGTRFTSPFIHWVLRYSDDEGT